MNGGYADDRDRGPGCVTTVALASALLFWSALAIVWCLWR